MVALLLAAVADDPRQRRAVHPLADQHVRGAGDHVGHVDIRVAGVGLGERVLRGGFQPVIEFLGHPVAQLVKQRLDVQPRHQQAEQPASPAELVEVADQRAPGAWVLDLHRDPAAVVPDRLVDLADRGGRGGRVVELLKLIAPVLAQVGRQHLVHGARGQRRSGFLQPGQRGPVRPGDLGRQRRLEDRQRLAQLHGAALELAQDPEDLVGRAPLDLLGHDLGGPPADPLPEAQCRAAHEPDGQPGELGGPGHRIARHIVHNDIVPHASARYGPAHPCRLIHEPSRLCLYNTR